MFLQNQQPRRARPFTADRRGPPIRIGTKCGRGSTHMAFRAPEPPKQTDVPADVAPKGFRRDVVTMLGRTDTPDTKLLAAATIGILYEVASDRRTRGQLRTAFEAAARVENCEEHIVQGAIEICGTTTSVVPSRIFHRALERCAKHAARKDVWQDLLSKMMPQVHADELTFDDIVLELLDN